ncbi:hypothetical protein F4804DRAFT_341382 [Jackrogersella minutella]|nr:hypothetical protein F4804DRAFT_341382 [Jackrogersella minutella]
MAGHAEDKKPIDDDGAPPPPPYSANDTAAAPPAPLPAQQQIKRQFPPAFSMYRESSWGQRHYMLGEHQAAPLYAVELHSGWSGQPDIVLHSGPDGGRAPLAAVERSAWGTSALVTLPPLVPRQAQRAQEKMEASGGFGHPAFTFSVETGPAARREVFEWRHSSGNAVKALNGRGSGWKLVRLATDAPSGIAGEGGAFVTGGATAGDGKEVVAVWCWASGSLTKKLKFQFLGSGVNGVLGERWSIMAVMTALRIWDRERRQRNNNAGAAGGGAGA